MSAGAGYFTLGRNYSEARGYFYEGQTTLEFEHTNQNPPWRSRGELGRALITTAVAALPFSRTGTSDLCRDFFTEMIR
jgi:hypothetical protein